MLPVNDKYHCALDIADKHRDYKLLQAIILKK